jgi:hypothetical protein
LQKSIRRHERALRRGRSLRAASCLRRLACSRRDSLSCFITSLKSAESGADTALAHNSRIRSSRRREGTSIERPKQIGLSKNPTSGVFVRYSIQCRRERDIPGSESQVSSKFCRFRNPRPWLTSSPEPHTPATASARRCRHTRPRRPTDKTRGRSRLPLPSLTQRFSTTPFSPSLYSPDRRSRSCRAGGIRRIRTAHPATSH